MKEHFHQGVSIGLDTVAGFAGTIGDTFYRIKDVLTGTFSKAWSDLKDAASNGVGGILDYVGSIPSRSLEALGNIGKILFDSGKALIRGFIDGIKRMIGNVKDAAADVVQAARDFFPFSPAKKGPFSGRGWVLYSGKSIGEAFAEGIRGTAQTVATAARGVITDARDAFDEVDIAFQGGDWGYGTLEKYLGTKSAQVLTKFASQAGETYRQVTRQIQEFTAAVNSEISEHVQQANQVVEEIRRPFDEAAAPMVEAGRSLGEAFAQGIADTQRQIEEAANNAVGAARDFFPFSPAKKGPFSGRGWVLYSGKAVGSAFAQGIADTAADAAAAAAKNCHYNTK